MTLIQKLKAVVESGGVVPKEITGLDYDAVIGAGFPKGHKKAGMPL